MLYNGLQSAAYFKGTLALHASRIRAFLDFYRFVYFLQLVCSFRRLLQTSTNLLLFLGFSGTSTDLADGKKSKKKSIYRRLRKSFRHATLRHSLSLGEKQTKKPSIFGSLYGHGHDVRGRSMSTKSPTHLTADSLGLPHVANHRKTSVTTDDLKCSQY